MRLPFRVWGCVCVRDVMVCLLESLMHLLCVYRRPAVVWFLWFDSISTRPRQEEQLLCQIRGKESKEDQGEEQTVLCLPQAHG